MSDSTGRDRRLLLGLLVAVIVVVGGLYVAGFAFASDRIPRETTVAGVDVGGLHPDRARRVLRNELAGRLGEPIEVVAEDQRLTLDPEEAGLDVDIPASIAQVPVGRSWSVSDMWENLVGGEDYEPVVVTVDDLLTERLQKFSDSVGQRPVEGTVDFTRSGAEPTYPEPGTALDVGAAAEAVRAAYPSDGTPVELEVDTIEPEASSSEVSRFMKKFANPAMSAPVTFKVGPQSAGAEPVQLRPARYAPVISTRPEDGRLVPQVDGKRLLRLLRPQLRAATDPPRDATVRIVDGRPRVVPAQKGVVIDRDGLMDSFLDVVAAKEGRRKAKVPTEKVAPEVTTAEVRALKITEKVSEFTTYYPHADYRNTNIGRAAEIVDGTILRPGETFSLNETVGERTAENGFAKGFIISDGVFKEDFGGGVSQVATTLFNAAFFAGLEDVEHKPHSFYIDRYPVGREATVAWPSVDLKFTNDTDHGVLIQTLHSPSSFSAQGALTVRMWSTKVWDITSRTSERYAHTSPETRHLTGEDCVPNEGYSGFQVDVTRVFRRHGEAEIDHTEKMHTTYTPSDTVICKEEPG